ncbi:hypothetical protein GALL_62000 [mine drainage metagenome]|uniref:Uncharacterized protein n=1 Tax=mine drainage metagenome TaxID=410659 RepID=A0A1J5T879_9ZZZZ
MEVILPSVSDLGVSELLEALFLEDVKPVVVFDIPDPELIALRLLTALWPDIRRRFALSTFALSPRKIGGRDFDLVFSPSNAKSKFSDWQGRRVDGRSSQVDRHRWTEAIVHRVFKDPLPKLLSDRDIDLLGDRDTDNAAALRIALLWEELIDKLDRMPTAALGLLDIANSGMVSYTMAMKALEPRLAKAMRMAADNLSPNDAWDFVGAIARKIQGQVMPPVTFAVEQLAAHLAEHASDGVISLFNKTDPKGAIDDLIPSIALGLGKGPAPLVEHMLVKLPSEIIASLALQGGALVSRLAMEDELIQRMGIVLSELDHELSDRVGRVLLPLLVEDRHYSAALPIFAKLDSQEIAAEMHWLAEANGLQSKRLSAELINRARDLVEGIHAVREVLISLGPSTRKNELLTLTIEPVETDIWWLLNERRVPKTTLGIVLENVLQRADDRQLAALLSNQEIGERVVAGLPNDAIDLLVRVVLQSNLPINAYMEAIRLVIPKIEDIKKFEIAHSAIEKCLRNRFDVDETGGILMLLEIIGSNIDGRWLVRTGLEHGIEAQVASRNLIVFEKAPAAARKRIVESVDELASALYGRHVVDLTGEAYGACAKLMFDAEKTSYKALVHAAGLLIPSLLNARSRAVSLMIAALFPIIYRELSKADEVPDLLKFIPFFDWDRCKTARHELVRAFMSSKWKAGDLALTAVRCRDLDKILKRVAKSIGGEEYLTCIENDLDRLEGSSRGLVELTIASIRYQETSSK